MRVTLRWYDVQAYDVWHGTQPSGAFIIAMASGWELRCRPASPTDPARPPHRAFPRLGAVRDWLHTPEGQEWLAQLPAVPR